MTTPPSRLTLQGRTYDEGEAGALSVRYGMPPFTVLDGRGGEWTSRKRAWVERIGIKSELGRPDGLLYDQMNAGGEFSATSVFDPYLCELAYRWYTRKADRILDPFSGGSVRGLVATRLDRNYHGIDLSAEQLAENEAQAKLPGILDGHPMPVWYQGDSRVLLANALADGGGPRFDYVFTCPPYHDLEQYSSDPLDLSNMSWPEFCNAYAEIIDLTVRLLRPDRFAGWVVGDMRWPNGTMKLLVEETIRAFGEAGASLYDKAVLLSPVGTMALRGNRQFRAGRKLVRGHQYLLVFIKGDWRGAVERLGDVDSSVELPSLAPGLAQMTIEEMLGAS